MSSKEDLNEIIEVLKELIDDSTVPRNVRDKIQKIIIILESQDDISIKVNKALNELDEVSDDSNVQAFTRTQLWNVVSMLEKIIA